jgi:hypothetical protein
MVSNAFTRLPLSSEQILHPEKYFNYERPIKVVLPDVTNLLNASTSTQLPTGTAGASPALALNPAQESTANSRQSTGTAGGSPASTRARISGRQNSAARPLPTLAWRRIDSDVNGEWNYYLILDQFLSASAESKRAAAGWAGDRYAVYEGPGGQVFLAQVAAWDTENDAREFFDAYVKRTELRYPGATRLAPSDLKLETRNSEPETKNIHSWKTTEGNVVIELHGLRVVILEGIPEGVDADALLKALWQ